MWTDNRIGRWLLTMLCAMLVFLLAACGSANANGTPTLSVQEIFTAAIETFSAQQAAQLALTPPTSEPTSTLLPTLPPLSPLPSFSFASPTLSSVGTSLCDNSSFVADVTIPDGTSIAPGASFVKTWKLLNSGTCTWSTSYKISFVGGDLMGGAAAFVTVPVPANNQTSISVSLVAPNASGTYKGTWRMQNDKGLSFGDAPWVSINVGAGGTPAATSAAGTAAAITTAGTAAATVEISGNVVHSLVNLTYTDGTQKTVKSNSKGDYSLTVPSGWSGTVTPSRAGNSFTPGNMTYTNVTSDQTAQNYTATP